MIKEYVIRGENGFTTWISVDNDKDIQIVDDGAHDAVYIPVGQIDELIDILQQIKKENE